MTKKQNKKLYRTSKPGQPNVLKVTRVVTRSLEFGLTLAKHRQTTREHTTTQPMREFPLKGARTVPDGAPVAPVEGSRRSSWNLTWRVPTRVPLGQHLTGSTAEICVATSRISSMLPSVLSSGIFVDAV